MSAFGAKRTWCYRRWRIDRSLMTHSGHCRDRNPAAQQYRGYAIPFVQTRKVLSSETTRFLHASWRRGGSMAARDARSTAQGGTDRCSGIDVPWFFQQRADEVIE
jgi:hypothetical protein